MSKKILVLFSLLIISAFILSACAAPAANAPEAAVVEEGSSSGGGSGSGGGNGSGSGSGGGNGSGGGDKAAEVNEPADTPAAALSITGKVGSEIGWSEEDVHAMNTLEVESTNSKGDSETYTGVLIRDLLTLAAPADDAETLVIVADDGYSVEVAVAEIMACDNCILSFRSKGGFSSVLPGYEKSFQVKGVVELQLK